MNKPTIKKRKSLPKWFFVLFPATLLFTLSYLGLYAYQRIKEKPQVSVLVAQIEIQKQQILQQSDVINTNWLHTLNPLVKDVRGRVYWSSIKQQGIMEFSNLPALSSNENYQLWIYDFDANKNTPISGIMKKGITKQSSNILFIPFTGATLVQRAFKFELLLKEDGKTIQQPLLLAQP